MYVPDNEHIWVPATVQKVDNDGKTFEVIVDGQEDPRL